MENPVLHLASSSPRRREILTALGVAFSFGGADLDESRVAGESVTDMVLRLAREKACAANADRLPVLGADTIVVLDDRVFGKPLSKGESLAMLKALSGRTHRVITAVALVSNGKLESAISETEVSFRDIRPDEADSYWQSGEPQGKAGGYAIQGLGGIFVQTLRGSYSGVVGLPVYETARLLGNAGVAVLRMQTQHD